MPHEISRRRWGGAVIAAAGFAAGAVALYVAQHVELDIRFKPAHAAMAVIDSSNLSVNNKTAAAVTELKFLQEDMNTKLEAISEALCLEGSYSSAGDVGGALGFGGGLGGGGALLGATESLDGFQFGFDAFGDLLDMSRALGVGGEKLRDIRSAQRMTTDLLGALERGDMRAVGRRVDLGNARAFFAEQSATDALATAFMMREELSSASNRVRRAGEAASDATCLREQVAALTGAVLLLNEEMQMQRSLQAAEVQQRASEHLLAMGTSPTWSDPDAGGAGSGNGQNPDAQPGSSDPFGQ